MLEQRRELSGSGDSPIRFRLEPATGVPTYLQLVHQVEHAISLGFLVRGDQLPRIRDAVAALAINPNTVVKAYRELERKGLVQPRPGRGTFVTGDRTGVDVEVLSALRRKLMRGWLRDAAAGGLDESSAVEVFTAAARDFFSQQPDARGEGQAEAGGLQ